MPSSIRNARRPRLALTALTGICVGLLAVCLPAGPARADVTELTPRINAGDANSRIRAMDELATFRDKAAPAVPELIQALGDENADIRVRAARTLAAIGPGASAAVPVLTKGLSDEQAMVRAYAAFALGEMGDASKPAVPDLAKAALDPDPTVRRAVVAALRDLKVSREVSIPLFVKVLEDAEPQNLMPALHTLAESGKQAVPFLADALQHEKACYWACIVAGEIGPDAKELIPLVAKMLTHQEPECRLQALVTLGRMGAESKSVVPQIVAQLEQGAPGLKYAAAYALAEIGDAPGATAALQKAVQSDDLFLRMVSAWALVRLNPQDDATNKQAVAVLIEGLKSKDKQTIAMAARTLAAIQAPSEDVAPALVEALQNADPYVIDQAVRALAALGKEAVPRVKRGLQNDKLRIHAVAVLRLVGKDAADAVPDLVEVLEKGGLTPEFRREANFALGAVGPGAAPAVGVLIKALDDPGQEVQYSACYALGQIGPEARAANLRLSKNVDSQDEFLKLGSVWALVKINPGNPRVAEVAGPRLSAALQNEQPHIRAEAARTLGELGTLARPYLSQLQRALQDESEEVKVAAAEALTKIGG
ncbi:MAG: HEAT repeat domain-containing protein [Pirellulaceae bacterium]|nr:HEAT repeat domain-containing protein [Pirellulaceae bacterium]